MSRRHVPAALLVLLLAAAALARVTPGPTVTDANVVEKVRTLRTPAEQLALANYYAAKADDEQSRIAFYEALFRAYNDLEGRQYEGMRQRARRLLKDARETAEQLDILATAHRTRAIVDE